MFINELSDSSSDTVAYKLNYFNYLQKLAIPGITSRVGTSNLTKAKNPETLLEINTSDVKARTFNRNDLRLRYMSKTLLEVEVCNITEIEIWTGIFQGYYLDFNQLTFDF